MDARLLRLALGAFAGSVESSLVVIVMPDVAAEVGVTLAESGWLIFVYSLAYGIGTPVFATLISSGVPEALSSTRGSCSLSMFSSEV